MNSLIKECCKCFEDKLNEEFYRDKKSSDGRQSYCIACKKQYNGDHCEKRKKYMKQWYKDHHDEKKQDYKQYRDEHREEMKQYQANHHEERRQWWKNRYNNNPSFKKSENLSRQLTNCLRKKQQKSKLENYLDCSLEVLYKWIEFQFDENMTWSNYGEYWQIDHILPRSHLNNCDEEEILACWNWRNLRPCTRQENCQKGKKIDYELYYQNVSLASEFLELNNQIEYSSDIESDSEDLINL